MQNTTCMTSHTGIPGEDDMHDESWPALMIR